MPRCDPARQTDTERALNFIRLMSNCYANDFVENVTDFRLNEGQSGFETSFFLYAFFDQWSSN